MENKAFQTAKMAIFVYAFQANRDIESLRDALHNIAIPDYCDHERYMEWVDRHIDAIDGVAEADATLLAQLCDQLLDGYKC